MQNRDHPTRQDLLAVRRLASDTGFFRPDEVDVAVELVEERLANGADSGYHFRFFDIGGSLAGYVCYGPIPCAIGSFDLYWIMVAKEKQGNGLGTRLLRLAEDSALSMGGRRMYVETAGNDLYRPTRAFYNRAGYFLAARLPDFYDSGEDKLIYQKNLV